MLYVTYQICKTVQRVWTVCIVCTIILSSALGIIIRSYQLIDALVSLIFFVWTTLVIIIRVSYCGFPGALYGSIIYCCKTTLPIILWITITFIFLKKCIVVLFIVISVSVAAFWENRCHGNVYQRGTRMALRQIMISGFGLLLLGWGPRPFGFWWCHGSMRRTARLRQRSGSSTKAAVVAAA
jgi:hypothetical protein